MNDVTHHQVTQWRKRLERRGWISLSRGVPPRRMLVEYHVVWQGWLFSGRCRLLDEPPDDWLEPGRPVFLLQRQFQIEGGVWRRARDPHAERGQVVRRWSTKTPRPGSRG